MTGRERFRAVVNGDEPDMIPVDPMLDSVVPTSVIGADPSEFYLNAQVCAESLIRCQEKYGFECIGFGPQWPAYVEMFGGSCVYPQGAYPYPESPIIRTVEDARRLTVPDPEGVDAFARMFEAVRLVRRELGDKVAIGGRCSGVFNVVRGFLGGERYLDALVRDPALVAAAAEVACVAVARVGEAFVKAGVDYIHNPDACASPAFMSPRQYQELARPYQARLFTELKKTGTVTVFHPCGGEYPILCQVRELPGVDAFHFSELVDLGIVRQIYGAQAIFWGNVDGREVMLLGGPKDVEAAVIRIIQGCGRLGRLVMGIGCAIPGNVPMDNLRALVEATHEHGMYPLV